VEGSGQLLQDILGKLQGLPPDAIAALDKETREAVGTQRFIPNPGPQTDAYYSKADIVLYGGAAGTGKGFLMLGLASQEHRNSIIFRRENTQLDGLEKDGASIFGADIPYNGQDHEWTWPDGRTVKLAGMQLANDWRKFAGRERQFIGYDEAAEFLEGQVSSMLAWLRGPPGQRCRIILASNPPRSQDGYWVQKWFAPWLDKGFTNPAAPGELRYAFGIGEERIEWVDSPEPRTVGPVTARPLSLTFLPARLHDNPYRDTEEYRSRLNSLPEPLRSQLMFGDFTAGVEDDLWQIIPSDWVRAAMNRWTSTPPDGVPMCAMGVDAAQGGRDNSVLAMRYDGWYAPLVVVPGALTPDGPSLSGLIIQHRRDTAKVIIDMGGGYGGSAYDHLKENVPNDQLIAFKGAEAATGRTADNQKGFISKRMQVYWRFREALDPSQPGGSPVFLPHDPQLLAELCAPRFDDSPNGFKFRADSTKERTTGRLGRSPDRADAVVMAWADGAKAASHGKNWEEKKAGRYAPVVVRSHTNRRRAR